MLADDGKDDDEHHADGDRHEQHEEGRHLSSNMKQTELYKPFISL